METKIVYFVHGTTTDNAASKCSGWKEAELNELGREQAIKLGETRNDVKFDIMFTSDLKRAVTSAELAFPNVEKIKDSRLRECNYGDFDGEDKSLVIYEEHIDEPFPNGESLNDVVARVESFINEVKEKYEGKTIGIVAHRAPQLALEVLTKGKTLEEAIEEDWRMRKAWQPGWDYIIKK